MWMTEECNVCLVIAGSYETPTERKTGEPSGMHGHVFGSANPEDEVTVGAFFMIWRNGKSITSWTGESIAQNAIMKLKKAFHLHCVANRLHSWPFITIYD